MDETDYLARAREADGLAEAAPTPFLRQSFRYLAEGWRDLARQASERARIRDEILHTVSRVLSQTH